jgi:multiple antibiotic resistance protein
MLRGNSLQSKSPSNDGAKGKRSLTPMMLFAASPGTITGVITLAVAHAKLALPVTALVAVVVAAGVMWIVMVLVAHGGTRASGGLLRDTATRFMGLIVLAMGVQFALTGFHDFSAAHP